MIERRDRGGCGRVREILRKDGRRKGKGEGRDKKGRVM